MQGDTDPPKGLKKTTGVAETKTVDHPADNHTPEKVPGNKAGLIYHDKPLFGVDIGYSSIKVMQINSHKNVNSVMGHGALDFDPKIIKDGVIVDTKAMAETLNKLLRDHVIGRINTSRAAMALPTVRTFVRSASLPISLSEAINDAVQTEIEQYIPLSAKELYSSYSVTKKDSKSVQVLIAAAPKKVADSYLAVADELGLEIIALEPSIMSVSRLFSSLDKPKEPTVIIDFGAVYTNVIVYDDGVITAGTVPGGGETLNSQIAKKLHINQQDSIFLKTHYGIGPGYKQKDILEAISDQLVNIVEEVRRVMRYYEEHAENRKISEIVITGEGSNLHGLNDYLTASLRFPARPFTPWKKVKFESTELPYEIDKSLYTTAGGLALLKPSEIFK